MVSQRQSGNTKMQKWKGVEAYQDARLINVLTPLTNKIAKMHFSWIANHQYAFESIKALIVGADCLTIVDHTNLGKNKISMTCNPSDWCTGACLSFRETWETAWLVTYD